LFNLEQKCVDRGVVYYYRVSMDNSILGLLKLRIKRGINLAIRDAIKGRASDPYVVVTMGDQVPTYNFYTNFFFL